MMIYFDPPIYTSPSLQISHDRPEYSFLPQPHHTGHHIGQTTTGVPAQSSTSSGSFTTDASAATPAATPHVAVRSEIDHPWLVGDRSVFKGCVIAPPCT